jgi:hypothetical protein
MAIVVCDICNKPVPRGEGYILTTQQVVYSPAYWEHTFKQRWPDVPMERLEPHLPLLAQRLAAQQSDWLVCNECICVFDVDRKQARRYCQEYWATGKAPLVPGGGAADMPQAGMAADQGWERAFGRKPKVSSASLLLAIAKGMGKEPHLLYFPGEKKFCQYCGAENKIDADFCEKCGKKLAEI